MGLLLQIALTIAGPVSMPVLDKIQRRIGIRYPKQVQWMQSHPILVSLLLGIIFCTPIIYGHFTNPLPRDDFHLGWWHPDFETPAYLPAEFQWKSGQSGGIFTPPAIPTEWAESQDKCLLYVSKREQPVRISAPQLAPQGEMLPLEVDKSLDWPKTMWCLDWPSNKTHPVEIRRNLAPN